MSALCAPLYPLANTFACRPKVGDSTLLWELCVPLREKRDKFLTQKRRVCNANVKRFYHAIA